MFSCNRAPKRQRTWRLGNEGSLPVAIVLLSAILAASAYLYESIYSKSKQTMKAVRQARWASYVNSAINTVLVPYHEAEKTYVAGLGGCAAPRPFWRALHEGSNCAASIRVFVQSAGAHPDLFSYPRGNAGCTIQTESSDCEHASRPLITIGVGASDVGQQLGGTQFSIYLVNAVPERQVIEFNLVTQDPAGRKDQTGFALRAMLGNSADYRAGGEQVIEERPDPGSRCPGGAFSPLLFFNGATQTCQNFVTVAGATGIAFYQDRYFAFDGTSGVVYDMLSAALGFPAQVRPDGSLSNGARVFPPYDPNTLITFSDITLLGDQIYYVAYSSTKGYVGALDMSQTPPARVHLCDQGTMGFGQNYNGIAALGWGDPLLPDASPSLSRLATFFAKTDGGNVDEIVVTATRPDTTTPFTYSCVVFRDRSLAHIDGTVGFDRVAAAKPFYIF